MSQEATSPVNKLVGWRRALLRRFVTQPPAKGSTAIEFTLLAIPFSMLVFAVLEGSISFAAQQVMANAARPTIAPSVPHRPDQGRRFLQAGSCAN